MQYILNSDGSVSRQKKKKNETPTATQKSNNKMTGTEALATVGKTIGNVATNMGTGALRTMESTADFVSDKVANPTERKLNYYYDYLTKGKKVANENLKDLIEMQERDIKKDRTSKFLEDVGYNDVVDKWEQGSLVNRNNFGGKVAQGIGGMVPSLVVGGAVGSKAALTDLSKLSGKQKALAALGNVGKTYKAQLPANLILGASSYGSGMEEALNEGATMEQARKFGLANALIEQGTEMITGGVPGLGGKGGIDGLIDPLIDKGSKGFTKAALKTLYRAGGEGLEEAAAEMLNPLAKKTYSDEPIDWGQTAKNAWEAAKIGAVTGAALGGSQTVGDFQRAQLENNMRKLPNLNDVERNALVELTIKRKSGQPLTEEDLGTIQYLNQKTSQIQEAQTAQQPIQEAQVTQQARPVQETTEQIEEKPKTNKSTSVKETMPNLSKSGFVYNDKMPTKELKAPDGYTILYHNTSANNLDSISKEGIKGGKNLDGYKASPEEGQAIWASKEPQKGNGGSTVAFLVPNEVAENSRVNKDEFMLYDNISPENIVQIDRELKNGIQMSDLERLATQSKSEKSFVDGATKIGLSKDAAKEIYNNFKGSSPNSGKTNEAHYNAVEKNSNLNEKEMKEISRRYKKVLEDTGMDFDYYNENATPEEMLGTIKLIKDMYDYDGFLEQARWESPEVRARTRNEYNKINRFINRFENIVNREQNNVENNQNMLYNERTNTEGSVENEFRRLQEESRNISDKEQQLYRRGSKEINDNLRRRLSRVLGERVESSRSSNSDDARVLKDSKSGNEFEVYENVDGKTFRDVFEIARTYTRNGELVDLHPVESGEYETGYNDTMNYVSKDGLSGFAITKDGDLISVFNANNKRGWLRAISPIINEKAKTLDCYMSENQPLHEMYEKIFGFKVASVMDYNMDYDHDDIAKNHNMPQVAFMVKTNNDIETKHFNKDQYDEAESYRNSLVDKEGTSDSSFSDEKLPDKNVTFEDINFEENGNEGAKPVEVLGEMPKKERLSITQKAKKYANEVKESGSFLRRKFVDKLQSVDMLDRQNNRKDNLYAEADRTHRSVAEAQYSIGDEQIDTDGNEYKNFTDKSGKKVSKSLIGIFDEVEKYGMNMKEFNEYLIDYLNLDRYDKVTEDGKSKAPRGLNYTKEMSEENIKKFEEKHPEAKRIAENVWQYSYNELDNRVKNGVMTKKQAENYKKETPHYVPISRDVEGYQSTMKKIDNRLVVNTQNKKIKGDSTAPILPIREAMAWNTVLNRSSQRINNAIKAVAQRYDAQDTNLSYSDSDLNINQDNVAVKSKDGKYYLTYFDGGKAKTFQVDKGMYEAFLPDQVYEWEKYFKIPATVDSFRKKLITDYNIKFLKNNAIKDVQDAMINTQYPKEFLGKYMDVATRLKNKNPDAKMQQYINEFKKAGGFSETYFADREFTSQKTKNPAKKALQMLNRANEYIELTPRLTEYILSREHGESVSVALHNAADVTTNFARGGVWAKKMNKWGFTFLNPSIQGADKAIRNLDPRNPRRFASVVARGALLGIGCGALNEALWNSGIFDKMPWDDDDDDDDGKKEYENLNEYIKNNYYIIPDKNGKPNIRIPKGRMMSVLQSIGRRGYKTAKGDGKFTENFKDLPSYAWGQVGPADPGNNNVFAPLIQAARNKSWSGNPIDSEYEVKNVAPEERYSVKTTAMAKKLGKALNISPKRIDYVFDQYSGAIGDLVIPMTNQYAETSSDNKFLEGLGAVFGNDMNLDPTFSNKQLGELYDNSNKYNTLTKEEKKKYKNEIGNKYLNEKIGEISEYNQQIKDIQASNKSNKEKMKETKELQKKINEIAEDANKTYKNVKKEGKYAATVGDSVYAKDNYGKWKKESDKTKEKRQSLGLDIEDYYYYKKEEAYTKPDGYQTSLVDGDKAKDKIALVDVFDFDPSDYLEYSYKINKIKAGKDTQRQVIEYIDSLPISAVQKAALYKKKYRSYKDYDRTIYNYIDNSDLTVQEKESLANFLKIK